MAKCNMFLVLVEHLAYFDLSVLVKQFTQCACIKWICKNLSKNAVQVAFYIVTAINLSDEILHQYCPEWAPRGIMCQCGVRFKIFCLKCIVVLLDVNYCGVGFRHMLDLSMISVSVVPPWSLWVQTTLKEHYTETHNF